jgi:hypothetical protein
MTDLDGIGPGIDVHLAVSQLDRESAAIFLARLDGAAQRLVVLAGRRHAGQCSPAFASHLGDRE